jgi:hypothetical protein
VQKNIKAGWISTCVGSLTQYNLRFANQPEGSSDIGHYESEQYTSALLVEIIREKFPTFAVRLTVKNTNPINFL